MPLEGTDLFVIQRQTGGSPLLKATAIQLNNYINKTLDDVTTLGNTTDNDITVGQVTLLGGGDNTQALQKQEIESLIAAISDLYVDVAGDTMTGNLTLGESKITLDASNGAASFAGNITLPGGGGNTQALQKQEITGLIAAIPAPDFTPYLEKTGDTMTGQLTLPGGGSNTQALQKQEITSLISAIPAPDFTPYVEKDGDNMSGNLTFNTNKIILNASSGSGTFTGTLEAANIDGGEYAT